MFPAISKLLFSAAKISARRERPFHLFRRFDPWRSLDEDRTFRLLLDVEDFNPADIDVKVDGGKLRIAAHRTAQHSNWRDSTQIMREYDLPKDVDAASLRHRIEAGLLVVEAPRRVTGDATRVRDENQFVMRVDMAGFESKDVTVSQHGREFTIEARQDVSRVDGDHCASKCLRSFRRTFILPENADPKALKARFTNEGRLEITCPYIKGEAPQSRKIDIEQE